MVKYQVFTLFVGLTTSAILIYLVRRAKLHVSLLVWWLFIIAGIIVFSVYPRLIDYIGAKLGIAYPPIIIAVVGFSLVFLKLLLIDINTTRNEIRFKKLIQRITLLEKELEELKKFQKN